MTATWGFVPGLGPNGASSVWTMQPRGFECVDLVAEACSQCPAHIRMAATDHSSKGTSPKVDSKSREIIAGRNPCYYDGHVSRTRL